MTFREEDDAQQEETVVDAAPEESEEETYEEFQHGEMAWDLFEGESFADQLEGIHRVVQITHKMLDVLTGLVKHGVPEDLGATSVSFNATESVALSLGLNLVGFFVPELREEASALLSRAVEAAQESERNYTDEERATIKEAMKNMMDARLSEAHGFTSVEDYRKARDAAQQEAAAEADAVVFGPELNMN